VSLAEIERRLCQLVRDTEVDARPVIWAGFSPGALDRPAIRHYMPTFHSLLHYRTLDISTLNLVTRNYASENLERDDAEHRAESDAEASLEFFGRFRALISKKAAARGKLEPTSA
jgi:oligoribonuclease (3'-5' exoribonuclease)